MRSDQAWEALSLELDVWEDCGRAATLWLRDDDTRTYTPGLQRLLDLGELNRVPISLAVIPDGCESVLVSTFKHYERLSVVQHGYAHKSHAPADKKKAEYGDHRENSTMLAELRRGRELLLEVFPAHFKPVLVPPWNRISEALMDFLPSVGIEGLSTYAPRPRREPVADLVQSNCHADLIDWRGSRSFIGEEVVLEKITGHLRRRREGDVDDEATGVLTHHLDHDEGCWKFLERLFRRTRSHSSVDWLTVSEVMWSV